MMKTDAIWFVAPLLCLCSCSHHSTAREGYGIAVQNLSSERISEANVQFGAFDFRNGLRTPGGGVVLPSGLRTYYPVPYAVPDTAKVMWRTGDGVLHDQQVEVGEHVPHGFTGYITFQIKDDTVSLFPEKD